MLLVGVSLAFVIHESANPHIAVTCTESSAVQALKDVHEEYKLRDIQISISNPSTDVLLTLSRSGVVEPIGKEWYFVRADDVVQVCLQRVQSLKARSNNPQTSLSSQEDKTSFFVRLQKQREVKFSVTDLEYGYGTSPLSKDRNSQLEPSLSKKP